MVGHGLVPDIPGIKVEDERLGMLRAGVAGLVGIGHTGFPGAQPVSFDKDSINLLLSEDFWVCEKSDGVRVLIFIIVPTVPNAEQEIYLIDRKNDYRQVHGLKFYHHEHTRPDGSPVLRTKTLLDGELVIDTDRRTGEQKLRLLLFDCVAIDGESCAKKSLGSRFGRLKNHLWPPYERYYAKRPEEAARAPFQVKLKDMQLAYGLDAVLKTHLPQLEHGNDGLIFTCLNSGYVTGTDPKILKWKPPSENSVDFKLQLRFPPDLDKDPSGRLPDLYAKPLFLLLIFKGSRGPEEYEFFDFMDVTDEEWEELKSSGQQLDDRIVEVAWWPGNEPDERNESQKIRGPHWHFLRIRDDKNDGNFDKVVHNILRSIKDGVEEEELVSCASAIRAAWKTPERESIRTGRPAPNAVRKKGGPGPPMVRGGMPGLIRR